MAKGAEKKNAVVGPPEITKPLVSIVVLPVVTFVREISGFRL